MNGNPPVQMYPNRIVFKIKTGYKLELLTPETMKLLGSTKKDVAKDKDGEGLSTHIKSFIQLINISPHSLTRMNTVNTEFSSVEV